MLLKNGLFNFFIFILALFFALKDYEVWTLPIKRVPEQEAKNELKNYPETPPHLVKENAPASINSSISIAARNIFSPERKDFPATTAMGQTRKPVARPQIVLYGVTIAEDYQSATVVNPGRILRKEERESMTLKIGEKIGEYNLAKILPDRITLEATGDSFDVLLYDPKVPKKKAETRIAEAKTGERIPVSAGTEIQNPGHQATAIITKEPVPEQLVPRPSIRFQEDNLPIRALSRQARSALISQTNTFKK